MRRYVALLAGLLALAGCAKEPAVAAPGGGELWGHTFLSTASTRTLVAGTRVQVRFADGRLGAQAGCNQLSAPARIEGERLVLGELVTTDMGCDAPRHEQDQWLATFLQSGPAVRVGDQDLVLEKDGASITFGDRLDADPNRKLTGAWTLESLLAGDTASSVPSGVHATVTFNENGTFGGSAGCNQFGGKYTRKGETLVFTDPAMTLVGCPDDRGAVEGKMVHVLQGSVRLTLEAARLRLTADDGSGLEFTRP